MRIVACVFAVISGLWLDGLAVGQELVIADGGRCEYQLVLPDDTSQAVIDQSLAQAADVLREMFLANGLMVPVVKESQAHKQRPGIYLGATNAAKRAGLSTNNLPVWTYIWKTSGRDFVIAGRDWVAPGQKRYDKPACSLGTIKGLADFMREYCGTRFLAPGGLVGIEFLPVKRIAVPADLYRRREPMVSYNSGDRPVTDINSIGLNLLNNVSSEYFGHTHELAVPAEKYAHTHPEYFALIGGRRIREHKHPWLEGVMVKEPHLCYSNKQVQELIYQDMLRSLDAGYPEYLSLQADGFQPCTCPDCQKMFDTDDWGEKLWQLNKQWAERLLKDRPGKYLVVSAYTVTEKPPQSFKQFPANLRVKCRSTAEAFQQWAGKTEAGLATYLHAWGGYHLCGYLPVRTPLFSEKIVRLYAQYNVKGVGLDSPPAIMWALEGPTVYVYARMFDDPNNNSALELTKEYITAAYGPAAPAMTRFFDELHHTLEAYSEVFGVDNGTFQHYRRADGRVVRYLTWQTKLRLIGFLYPPETLDLLESHLSQAERTPGLSEKHKLRLALARREFDYLKSTARVVHLYNAYQVRRDKSSLEQLLAEMEARQAMILQWYDKTRQARPGVYLQKPISPQWRMFIGGEGYYNTHLLANGGSYLSQPVPPFTWDLAEMRRSALLEPKGVVAKKVTAALKLDAQQWESLPGEKLGPRSLGAPAPKCATYVKVAYDDHALYVRFDAALPEDWQRPAAIKSDDPRLLQHESVSLVLAPEGNTARYYRFAGGVEATARYDARNGFIEDAIDPRFNQDDTSWNPDWTYSCAIAADAKSWCAMMVIPFASLGVAPPASGMQWKVNFGRVSQNRPSGPREESLWSANPGTSSIGDRDAYGVLRFQ